MGNNCQGQCGGCYRRDIEILVLYSIYPRKVNNNKSSLKNLSILPKIANPEAKKVRIQISKEIYLISNKNRKVPDK